MRKAQLHGRRWRKIRRQWLTDHPFCVFCEARGILTPATEVDHIQKHNLDPVLFYDLNNLQSLCSPCHRSIKAQMERSGVVRGSDEQGLPIDPNHHWF